MSSKNSVDRDNIVENFSSLSPSPSPSNTLSIQIPKHNETYNSKNTGTTAASSSSSSSGKSVRKHDSKKDKKKPKLLDWFRNKLYPINHAKVYAALNTFDEYSNKNTKSDIPKIEECKVYLKDVIDSVSRNDIRKNIVTAQETCQAVLDICKQKVFNVEEENLKYDINTAYENFEKAKRYRQEKKLRRIGYDGGKKTRKLRKHGKKNAKRRKTRRYR